MKHLLAATILSAAVFTAVADDEASNRPVVWASEYGITYAKSVPTEDYGQEGRTVLYSVEAEEDVLIASYDWYSGEMYIGGPGGTTIVRLGPWQRGASPGEDHFAIGFYRDSRTLREYSTLDLEAMGSGISNSVSHYEVFGERLGFRWITGNEYVFEIAGVSGRVFSFSLETGEILEEADK